MSANVSILGNVGRTPESRLTPQGDVIASFSIASNSVRKTKDGEVKKTDWFRVTAIGKQAETLMKFSKKGDRLLVQGKLTLNPWMDRQGSPQVSADLFLQDFQFAGGGNERAQSDENTEIAAASDEFSAEYSPEHTVETEISADVQEIENQGYNN
jgi:single-strand DNA-binding protein